MPGKWQLKDHEAERLLFDGRLLTAVVLIVMLFISLIFKLVNLQITQYEYFSARSDGNRLHSQYVPPARGLIFDRSGELLADNQPIFNLTVVQEHVMDIDETLNFLATLIRLNDEDISQFSLVLIHERVIDNLRTITVLIYQELNTDIKGDPN